jgi:hypothetical protein
MSIASETILLPLIIADGVCDTLGIERKIYSKQLVSSIEKKYRVDKNFRNLVKRDPAHGRDLIKHYMTEETKATVLKTASSIR